MLMTARPASSYRSVASAVRTRLLDLRQNDRPRRELDNVMRARINTITALLELGSTYAPRPHNELDTPAGSPAKVDLAEELVRYVPKHLDDYQDPDNFNMGTWVQEAVPLLEGLRNGATWSGLEDRQRQFINVELLPFLSELLSTPPEAPD